MSQSRLLCLGVGLVVAALAGCDGTLIPTDPLDAARQADTSVRVDAAPDAAPETVDAAVIRDMARPPVDMGLPPADMAQPPADMARPPADMAAPVDMAPPMPDTGPPDVGVAPDMGPDLCGANVACFATRNGPPMNDVRLRQHFLEAPDGDGVIGAEPPQGTFDLSRLEIFTNGGFGAVPDGLSLVNGAGTRGATTFEDGRWAVKITFDMSLRWTLEDGTEISVPLAGDLAIAGCFIFNRDRIETVLNPGCAPIFAGDIPPDELPFTYDGRQDRFWLRVPVWPGALLELVPEADRLPLRQLLLGPTQIVLSFERPCQSDDACPESGNRCLGPMRCLEGPHGGPLCQVDPANAVECPSAGPCSRGLCIPATGLCEQRPTVGDPCNTDWCVVGGTCDAAGVCRGALRGCDDGQACTVDACDSQGRECTHVPRPEGTLCDDGALCQVSTACRDGECVGQPKNCDAQDECHFNGLCDPQTGVCSQPLRRDGSRCAAGGACVVDGRCVVGNCVGVPDTCQAPPSPICEGGLLTVFEVVGECLPEGGRCTYSSMSVPCVGGCRGGACVDVCAAEGAGAACDDGNPCTEGDICGQSGLCRGLPMACPQNGDACTTALCDLQTGACVERSAPEGALCDDGDLCTQIDRCEAGLCVGARPVECEAQGTCNGVGVCDPETGLCSDPQLPAGTACDDGNACSTDDICDDEAACSGDRLIDLFEPNQLAPGTQIEQITACSENLNRFLWARIDDAADTDRYFFRDDFCDDFRDIEPVVQLMSGGTAFDLCMGFECGSGATLGLACSVGQLRMVGGEPACCTTVGRGETGSVRLTPRCDAQTNEGVVHVAVTASDVAACGAYELRWGDF